MLYEVITICGIDAHTLREVARVYASARNAIIFWGMGVSQHVHGTDNSRALISLARITSYNVCYTKLLRASWAASHWNL